VTPLTLPIVIATAIPAGVVEMVTPGDNTRVIPVREGIELSLLNKRTGAMPAAKKTTISPSLNPSPCNKMIKQGKERRNFGFSVR
jgi:hypothetical protein